MKDIETRNDIEFLMRDFYAKLLTDPAISYIFTDVAKIDLESHLPHLTDFWEQSVLYQGSYRKNVLQIHQDLNSKVAFTDLHFEVWLRHFNDSVDNNFSGSNAERMKTRALSIASVMKIKIYTK